MPVRIVFRTRYPRGSSGTSGGRGVMPVEHTPESVPDRAAPCWLALTGLVPRAANHASSVFSSGTGCAERMPSIRSKTDAAMAFCEADGLNGTEITFGTVDDSFHAAVLRVDVHLVQDFRGARVLASSSVSRWSMSWPASAKSYPLDATVTATIGMPASIRCVQLIHAPRPQQDIGRLQQHEHVRVDHVLAELAQVLQVVAVEEDLGAERALELGFEVSRLHRARELVVAEEGGERLRRRAALLLRGDDRRARCRLRHRDLRRLGRVQLGARLRRIPNDGVDRGFDLLEVHRLRAGGEKLPVERRHQLVIHILQIARVLDADLFERRRELRAVSRLHLGVEPFSNGLRGHRARAPAAGMRAESRALLWRRHAFCLGLHAKIKGIRKTMGPLDVTRESRRSSREDVCTAPRAGAAGALRLPRGRAAPRQPHGRAPKTCATGRRQWLAGAEMKDAHRRAPHARRGGLRRQRALVHGRRDDRRRERVPRRADGDRRGEGGVHV